MKIKQYIDRADNVMVMRITGEITEKISNLAMFKKLLKQSLDFTQLRISNHSLVFTTLELQRQQPDRVYLLCWSDVCRLLREQSVVIFSYRGEWYNEKDEG